MEKKVKEKNKNLIMVAIITVVCIVLISLFFSIFAK